MLESYNWKFVVERWLNAMQYQTKEGDCSVDCASQGSFAEEDSCDCGGMSTPGHWAEATEKLYERHCLVIKIVSSFFAYLIKFLYL